MEVHELVLIRARAKALPHILPGAIEVLLVDFRVGVTLAEHLGTDTPQNSYNQKIFQHLPKGGYLRESRRHTGNTPEKSEINRYSHLLHIRQFKIVANGDKTTSANACITTKGLGEHKHIYPTVLKVHCEVYSYAMSSTTGYD